MDILGLIAVPNWILWMTGMLGAAYVYLTWNFDYWSKQGVSGPKPYPIIGTFYVVFQHGISEAESYMLRTYGKMVGTFVLRTPAFTVADPDVLRQLFIKDFPDFRERMPFEMPGPMKTSLFHSRGEIWQQLRHLLTPAFTTGKLKQMLPLVGMASDNFVKNMADKCKNNESFEMKEYSGAFSMDVIASVAFGLDLDSQNNKDDPFLYHAKKLMDASLLNPLILIMIFLPSMVKYVERVGLGSFNSASDKFFCNIVKETLQQRRQGIGVRPDMLQMMLEAEQHLGEVEGEPDNQQDVDDMSVAAPKKRKTGLSEENIIAQCILFFLAGYDTTSSALSFLYYNLATHQDIQDRVVEEINSIMGDRAEPIHEDLSKMTYMEMCINESLRMYPPVMRTDRQAGNDCQLKGIRIKKGTMIGIPIRAVHYDPDIWPEPTRFDPERFAPETKASRDSMGFLPFGLGPRMCIGMRLAIMEIKILTVKFLTNYRVVTCAETQIPIRLANKVVTSAENGVWLKVENRE